MKTDTAPYEITEENFNMRAADSLPESYKTACGMRSCFSIVVRHLATDQKFEHGMTSPTVLVGSDPSCSFRLPNSIASSKELLFQVVFGRIFCLGLGDSEDESLRIKRRALGAARVEVNGFEVQAFEEKGQNSEVERALDLSADRQDDDPPLGQFELAMRNEGRRNVVIPLARPITVMGRSQRCRVCFNSWSVSRFHAACISTATGVWVVDLSSRTGTFVREVPVRLQLLQPGDRFRIGPSRFEFRRATDSLQESATVPSSQPVVDKSFPLAPKVHATSVIDDRGGGAGDEAFALVASLANAIALSSGSQSLPADAQTVARTLNDMLRVQSLQLEELRRLTAYLSSHKTPPLALLKDGDAEAAPPKPQSTPIKPTGALVGPAPEPNVHEWFQHENDEMEERSVARILKRILGQR